MTTKMSAQEYRDMLAAMVESDDFDLRVEELSAEAANAGDTRQEQLCERALHGDVDARTECAAVMYEVQS